jgi:hypothetical protein
LFGSRRHAVHNTRLETAASRTLSQESCAKWASAIKLPCQWHVATQCCQIDVLSGMQVNIVYNEYTEYNNQHCQIDVLSGMQVNTAHNEYTTALKVQRLLEPIGMLYAR